VSILRACCRFYNKAFNCIPALREACIEHSQGQAFNTFLEQMAAKYEHDRLRADFWRRITDAKITLVSTDESSAVETTHDQSEAFLQQHTPTQQVAASCKLLHDVGHSTTICSCQLT
jgi:hypothetical protein